MLMLISVSLSAQDNLLKGKVVEQNDQPVVGAVVLVEGTDIAAITDIDGNYQLGLPGGDVTVTVSCLGYVSQSVQVSDKQGILNIILDPNVTELDEIVVVGYGEQTRKSITASVSRLSGDNVQDVPITTLGEGLKGKISGLRVTQSDNSPGGAFTYRIRGGSSINGNNSPLILVDGVERDFSTINPNDISSIEVLKDAASCAIYGARASNGIILVTTKKGSYNNKLRITFEANLAYQDTETEIDFMGAEDYIRITRLAVAEYLDVPERAAAAKNYLNGATSAGIGNKPNGMFSTRYFNPETDKLPKGYQLMEDPLDPTKQIMFKETDWQSLMYRPALWQNYYVGIDGGGDRIRYKASLNYNTDEGVAISTGYDRFNFKINMDGKITDNLTASIGADFARTNTEAYANQRNTISRALANAPTMNAYYEDGTPVEGFNATSQTPLFYNEYYDRTNQKDYLSIHGGLKWDIVKGLTANVSGSFFKNTSKNTEFIKENFHDATRKSSWGQTSTERRKADAYLQYQNKFGKHNLSVMAGYSYQYRNYETVSLAGTGSTSDKITTINGSSTFDPSDITSSVQMESQMGFFGRINYDYAGKYLITATFREDASSKFAPGNRWGFFPGVSAGWIITEENWMKNVKWLNLLKLRASYGSTGNSDGVGIYDAYGSFAANHIYNGNAGIKPSDMPNETLKWETTTQLDLGIDLSLLNNRIFLTADWYNKNTNDLLYEQNLPNTTGFSTIWTNIGKVRFWGYDIELTTHNIQKKNFSWDSRLTFSYTANEVIELPDNGIAKGRTDGIALGDGTYFGGIAEGEPLYRFYGYWATGILETEEQVANAHYDALSRLPVKGLKRVGDYEWADRNGDKQITKADQFCLGVSVAPYTGGFGNDFRIKDFTLSIYMDWALGHSIYDESYNRYFFSTYTMNYALAEEVKNCWKKPGDKTHLAKFTANDSAWGNDNYNRSANQIFTYKGDYLCIREVSLQYTIPEKVLRKTPFKGVSVNIAGNNLHYFTAVKGISPEIGTNSTYKEGYNNYPPIRRISFGVKLTF